MAELVRLLVVDDEIAIRRFLKASVDPGAFDILEAEDGAGAIRMAATESPDVILLDLGLPDLDGVEVCRRIREWSTIPIIVLSARGRESDKVDALDAGADDYLTKPFGTKELLARVRVALRHTARLSTPNPIVVSGELSIDLADRKVLKAGVEVRLTPNEYKFVAVLARNADKVVTHQQLLREVWGPEYDTEVHYLRVYAQQIRTKIEDDPARPVHLVTESGVGYRLRSELDES